jgi:hypothetical protein
LTAAVFGARMPAHSIRNDQETSQMTALPYSLTSASVKRRPWTYEDCPHLMAVPLGQPEVLLMYSSAFPAPCH